MRTTPSNKPVTTSATVDPDRASQLIALIHQEQGKTFGSILNIGKHLGELRPLAKGDWARQLKALGMSPRVASRHMRISESSLKEIGLNESEIATRMPTDVMKLEWLAKLTLEQVTKLAADLNLKQASRAEVEDAVRELLGQPAAKPRKSTDPPARIDRHFDGVVKLIAKHLAEGGSPADLEDVVSSGLHKVNDALEGALATDSSAEAE
jgi:hypothetical protein